MIIESGAPDMARRSVVRQTMVRPYDGEPALVPAGGDLLHRRAFSFQDADGCGDLRGLISRLDCLARLGVTRLWLDPVHRVRFATTATTWRT